MKPSDGTGWRGGCFETRSARNEIMPAKHRPNFLILIALLTVLILPMGVFGQQTAREICNSGFAKQMKGDLDGAIVDFSKAIELDPKLAVAYHNRGTAKRIMGDLDGAIADSSKAIELDPQDAFAYYDRGVTKQAKGDLDGAIADCSKAIELEPSNASAYFHRGMAKKAKGDPSEADADFAQAEKLRAIQPPLLLPSLPR